MSRNSMTSGKHNESGDSPAAVRKLAVEVLGRVLWQGEFLDQALERALGPQPRATGPLIQEMCYGTVRWAIQLQALGTQLLKRPLRNKDRDVLALLLLGLYQLRHMHIKPYAAVNETVATAAALGKPWAKDLINACLRGYLKRRDELEAGLTADEHVASNHPLWLWQRLKQDWPQQWQAITQANDARPPMSLRVNLSKISRADYQQLLLQQELASEPLSVTEGGLILQTPVAVTQLPGFDRGLVSVQDGAAQLAAVLLDAQAGERVLDACAAPGGKTGHLLEHTAGLDQLVAVELDPKRLLRVRDNLQRLELQATLVQDDVNATQRWWDQRPFDRILVDAPCSATGVIRRHPDIKLHRTPEQVLSAQQAQAQILDSVWPLLAPGGMLLYATCSVLPAENGQQIDAFLARHERAEAIVLNGITGLAHERQGPGQQILPGDHNMDGFYYAYIKKN